MKPLFRMEGKLMDIDDYLDSRKLVSNQLDSDFDVQFNEMYEEALDNSLKL